MPIDDMMVATPAGDFEVRRQGAADAPLVLGLHGFPDTAATFDALGVALAGAGFRFAAVQMRGHAASVLEVPKARTLFDTLASDALGVADALAPGEPFAVVGHDNGAFATYSLLRLAGERARAAVTLAAPHPAAAFANTGKLPSQMWRSRYAMLFQVPGLAEWWASRSDFGYLETLWRRWAAPGWTLPAAHLAEVKRAMRKSWPAPLLHYRAMPFGGDRTVLPQPVLYLAGAEDGCVLPATGEGQERFFRGEFVAHTVPGVGHFPHLERPDLVNPMIVAWLRRHAGDASLARGGPRAAGSAA